MDLFELHNQLADLIVRLNDRKAVRWSIAGGVCVIDLIVRLLSTNPTSASFAVPSTVVGSFLGFAPAIVANWLSTVGAIWLTKENYSETNFYALAWGFFLALVGGAINLVIRRDRTLALDRYRSMKELEGVKRSLESQVKEQVAALRISDEALHIMVDGVRDYAIIMITNEGVIASWNSGAERIKGWKAHEIIGQPYSMLFPSDMLELGAPEKALTCARTTGRYHEKSRRLRKDGSVFVAEITMTALFDQTGSPRGFAKITRDITSLDEAENIVARNHRAATLGELAGGVAHDFNNVLQIISGGTAMIQEQPNDINIVKRCAERMTRAALRGSDISGRLLAFARGDGLHFGGLDIGSLFENIAELLQPLLPANIAIKTLVQRDLPPVMADRSQLETILVNLATNARDAMPNGGELSYNADAIQLDADNTLDLSPGTYIRISVRDSGSGMNENLLTRVAEPYFTTKPQGKGTGLGLSMAKRYAEQSGGTLQIESEITKYTEVSIWLPAAVSSYDEDSVVTVPKRSDPKDQSIAALRILIVEDDDIVRDMMISCLRNASTLAAASGEEALKMLTDPGVVVDVLISTYSLPGISGVVTIRQAKRMRPELSALLVTGSINEVMSSGDRSHFTMLRKPFSPTQLVEAIAALI